jgi:deoxyribonuclease-4
MPPRPRARVGAHVSVAGGLAKALPRAREIGAEVIQVFVSSPRAWAPPPPDPEGDAAFAEACGVDVFVHAPYLINFGSPSADTLARSGDALAFALRRGAAIGARGVVVHAGSAVLGS